MNTPTTPTAQTAPEGAQITPPNVAPTLRWDGEGSPGDKCRFVVALENDGWHDLRIEVDTDDCDRRHAEAQMQIVIDRCNSHAALTASNAELRRALEWAMGQLPAAKSMMSDEATLTDYDEQHAQARAALNKSTH